MHQTHDVIYHYTGPWGRKSKCRVRIYKAVGHLPIVLATELPENTGTSIANMVDELASTLWRAHLAHALECIRWIVHQPPVAATAYGPRRLEQFDEVLFNIVGSYELTALVWIRPDAAFVYQSIGDLSTSTALP